MSEADPVEVTVDAVVGEEPICAVEGETDVLVAADADTAEIVTVVLKFFCRSCASAKLIAES